MWHDKEGEVPRERKIEGRQESEVAQWMVACCGARWALMCAGEEEGEWMGWQQVGEQVSPCQLLITLIGVIS